MAILNFPNITPETQDFGMMYNTQVSTSPISGLAQTVELPGARWKGSMSFRDMTPSESAELKAFLLELRGSSGRFFYGDVTHTSPFTTITGSPTIAGGSSPRVITCTISTGSFSVGDYIQIGTDDERELKMIINVANGPTTPDLTLESMIRRTDYVGKSVVYNNPKGVFMLSSSDQAIWGARSKAQLSDINIEFIEAFL